MRPIVRWFVLLVVLVTAETRAGAVAADNAQAKLTAGDLAMVLQRTDGGIALTSLSDTAAKQELSAAKPLPLFEITLRNVKTKEELRLAADDGWGQVDLQYDPAGGTTIRWAQSKADALAGSALQVTARAIPEPEKSGIRWTLAVNSPGEDWSVWRVVFPQVALGDLGPETSVLFPRGSGEVKRGAGREAFRLEGPYPGGWVGMQFMACYAPDRKTGLYFAMHDPWGSTRNLLAVSQPAEHATTLQFDHPAENMGKPGNRFSLPGEAVWRLLRGDWFDASVMYRDWARVGAKWYPPLGAEGREDTPPWMRELSVWVMTGGPPDQVVPDVEHFAKEIGIPVGLHWYNWHEIPFDNDYPHYFPTKQGFADAVAKLQEGGVFVMPYINGRLWDTRDKGAEDFEFGKVAQPAVTKDPDGKPIVETYGSKEADGSKVALGVMCPATELWRAKVRATVLRLMNECGVKGVYIDQVAAATPVLCFDPAHGHPLGGGHWWNEGYWTLMDSLRAAMPKDRMLTTECNAEPFVKSFDGYLTWHWQYDDQVPAFPAVYGGSIQMFGRAYREGETKELALRMKAGQQLVYGEQIGWFHPNVIRDEPSAAYLRQVVGLRWRLRRYFFAGEMARPPKLAGEMPSVRADWQWTPDWWVENDAVLAGAWRLPRENRTVLILTNTSDKPVTAKLAVDADSYGVPGAEVRVTRLTAEGPGETFTAPSTFERELTFAPASAWAWELAAP